MKRDLITAVFAALICCTISVTAEAQDTLVLNDSRELYVKVIEIDNDKVSYRKSDNLNGPLYSCALKEVFMAIYKGGKREMFTAVARTAAAAATGGNGQPPAANAVLSNETFRLQLKKIEHRLNRYNDETVIGEADVFTGNNFFVTVGFTATQKKKSLPDFSHPRPAHVAKSGISIQITSAQMKDYLFEKYENNSGTGLGWVLSPCLLSGDTGNSCQVAFLKKPRQTDTDVSWLQGKLDFEKYELKSCASLEERMLSVILLWLTKNFSIQK